MKSLSICLRMSWIFHSIKMMNESEIPVSVCPSVFMYTMYENENLKEKHDISTKVRRN